MCAREGLQTLFSPLPTRWHRPATHSALVCGEVPPASSEVLGLELRSPWASPGRVGSMCRSWGDLGFSSVGRCLHRPSGYSCQTQLDPGQAVHGLVPPQPRPGALGRRSSLLRWPWGRGSWVGQAEGRLGRAGSRCQVVRGGLCSGACWPCHGSACSPCLERVTRRHISGPRSGLVSDSGLGALCSLMAWA